VTQALLSTASFVFVSFDLTDATFHFKKTRGFELTRREINPDL